MDGAGTGGAAATHQPAPKPYTTAGVDWARESKSERMDQVLQAGLPATGVSAPEPLRAAFGWASTCNAVVSEAGGRGKVLAFMLICNTWAWWRCECLLEQTTLARAGWGKSPCPVRRGRGKQRSLVFEPVIPCFPLYSTGGSEALCRS